ncbi:aspartate aminotransferase family protein [Flexithrix dorotheae]|uniref:aspartate aminotransferase family protein n=1 Tax=Flexithrix dorotheae TaxID=70993 RepID=UPI0003824775|nr:aminotransferase class III-fold pyridoxal phosphate-dependent enzyme [Flexithrix dorotheae]
MNMFDVYPVFGIKPVKGEGSYVWDSEGNKYLDLYGGHAVISIGHSHPHFVESISNQLKELAFYSNFIINPLQEKFARKLGEVSGYQDYNLFLCNSGAEANENAIKLASFYNGKKKVISFTKGFHGRTSLSVAVTDNPKIVAPVNETDNAIILPFNDEKALEKAFQEEEISAVIIEGIQGIGGINLPNPSFIKKIERLCKDNNAVFIADAVQCGYGRTGKFFSHDHFEVKADIYTMAKGMGNGFPIGGIAISPKIEAVYGMLGSTFGGNHMACAAGIAVLEVMEKENLMENATQVGNYLIQELKGMGIAKEVRGIGLMIGIEFDFPIKEIRTKLLFENKIFTGSASNPNTLRLLPPLNLTKAQATVFLETLNEVLKAV